VLAAAGRHALIERGEDAHGAQHAGAGVADRGAGLDRRGVGQAVHPHGAAHRLGDHVEAEIVRVRAVGREALHLGEDQARVELRQARPVEAEPRESAGRHVLDQHVGLPDHAREQRLAFFALEVAGDAAFIEVVEDEIMRVGIGTVGETPAPRLAAVGLLDLDDLGAEPRQRLGA
jgi:hypothetical protein